MRNRITLALFLIVSLVQVQAQTNKQWGDQGDSTYNNPVLPGDYSDIDAIRVGDDFYAISSTFQFSPGMVVIHSQDLVNWEIIGHVVSDMRQIGPELNWDRMNRYGRGIWAGAIRYHDGKFYVYFCTPDEGFFMSTATEPAGPWEPLHQLWKVSGWDDCCPFWDDDGQAYLVASNFADNYKIHLFRMSEEGKKLDHGSDTVLYQARGSEANKFYKINGWYYHYFSQVESEGRVIMMGRSRDIYGPYETRQLNHVDQDIDREPNQGGLIQVADSSWWFFTHQGRTGYWEGRTASLLPVTWINEWPIIGKVGTDTIGNMVWSSTKPVQGKPPLQPQTNDEFSESEMAVQWEWNYQPRKEKWSLHEHPGFLRLHAFVPLPARGNQNTRPVLFRAGNTLTQRSMRSESSVATVKLSIENMADGQLVGLCHFGKAYTTIGIRQKDGVRSLVYDVNGKETYGEVIEITKIWLRSTWDYEGINQYAYSLDGKQFIPFGNTSRLSWGYYRGDRIGIFNYNQVQEEGFVDIDWFRYEY